MKYVVDNDLHIHTHLSICSDDDEQTPINILQIAKKRKMKTICITDHYWDDAVPCNTGVNWWYEKQNFEHISQSLPLPKDDEVRFLFGCEVDLDSSLHVGLPRSRWDDFDFIIVSTTHFHHLTAEGMGNYDEPTLAKVWVKRLEAVLNSDLPFKKVGIAHLACGLIAMDSREKALRILDLIPESEMKRLFKKAAELGAGIELNYDDIKCKDEEVKTIYRMFHIAKGCGCKFYLGSDAHERVAFDNVDVAFARAIDILGLEEEDKFLLAD